MKKLMTIFGAILLVFALTISLFSCGDDKKDDDDNTTVSDDVNLNDDAGDINIDDVNKLIDTYQDVLTTVDEMNLDSDNEKEVDMDDVNDLIDQSQDLMKKYDE